MCSNQLEIMCLCVVGYSLNPCMHHGIHETLFWSEVSIKPLDAYGAFTYYRNYCKY